MAVCLSETYWLLPSAHEADIKEFKMVEGFHTLTMKSSNNFLTCQLRLLKF